MRACVPGVTEEGRGEQDKQLERTNIKFDWDKYVDEDEEDDEGFDMSALNGAAKFGGDDSFLDEDDEPDSDDDGAHPAAPPRISPTGNAALRAASAATADLPDLDDTPGDIDTTGAGGASSTGATST